MTGLEAIENSIPVWRDIPPLGRWVIVWTTATVATVVSCRWRRGANLSDRDAIDIGLSWIPIFGVYRLLRKAIFSEVLQEILGFDVLFLALGIFLSTRVALATIIRLSRPEDNNP